jgi:Cdc6-like AAA superfamily ATPase
MTKRKKEIYILLFTFLIGVFTNIATDAFPQDWQNYLWISWLPLILFLVVIIVLQFVPDDEIITSTTKNRSRMLDKVEVFWVNDILEKSFHQNVRMDLILRYAPEAILHPLDEIVPRPISSKDTFSTSIIKIFDEFGGDLLILGAPGSGKTTLLLELTKYLIARARHDNDLGIPVVFNLSTWSENRNSIFNWLIDELNIRYNVPKKICKEWVADNSIIPMLDGLDEVQNEYRESCIEAINLFRRTHGLLPFVVCSREDDYCKLKKKLRLQGAVVVQPLTKEHL